MAHKISSLEELQRKKELLKAEIKETEDLLTFKHPRESLSLMTNGISDRYLKEKQDDDGNTKLAIKTDHLFQNIKNTVITEVKESPVFGFSDPQKRNKMVEGALSFAVVGLVGGLTRRLLYHRKWNKKLLGLVVVYAGPVVLDFVQKKLGEYQRNRSISSMEQLI